MRFLFAWLLPHSEGVVERRIGTIPIQTSNSDGSTTQPLVAELQYWRSWRVILNVTIFDSPGAKLKRSNPFSSLTGLDFSAACNWGRFVSLPEALSVNS